MPPYCRYALARSPKQFSSERALFSQRFKAQLTRRSGRRLKREDSFPILYMTLSEREEARGSYDKVDSIEEKGTKSGREGNYAVSRERKKAVVEDWIANAIQKDVKGIVAEFEKCDKEMNAAPVFGDRDNVKNRYRDIGCVEKTRVVLKDVDVSQNYIHANYIRSTWCKKRFICTQAPLDTTTEDFWHMVCQEHSDFIVMLCGLVEENCSVCAEYWPQKQGEKLQLQGFEIKNDGFDKIELVENDRTFTVIKSKLRVSSRLGIHSCSHFYWSQWADRKGSPSFEIIRLIAREVRRSRRPTVVHCSTGVGRTGAFVAIELILEMLMDGHKCDMPELLRILRNQRAMAINCCEQYIGVYQQTMLYFEKRKRIPSSYRLQAHEFIERCRKESKCDVNDNTSLITREITK
ncbi:unnamed protein product [Anisakis simplex]|uniref:Protein-tyrosine phosphatase n=1 Tax=Anisakis simplex TaxID=6269 RepID=A0A0M3JUF4_ANISI|nr:unnamed protein product [Anisakis simplex]